MQETRREEGQEMDNGDASVMDVPCEKRIMRGD